MFSHDFNIYETLAKLDALLESGHDELPLPINRAEYAVLTKTLVQGTVELLWHIARHSVLAFETATSFEPILARHVSTMTVDSDSYSSDEIVTIGPPSLVAPSGAMEAMKTWNIGTIETMADLSILARLWSSYLYSEPESDEEGVIYTEYARLAERVSHRCLPAVQQLYAAGILRLTDLRTGDRHPLEVARLCDTYIEACIRTEELELPSASKKSKAPAKKSRERKRNR